MKIQMNILAVSLFTVALFACAAATRAQTAQMSFGGFAWSDVIGWIHLGGEHYGVTQDKSGTLGGFAWSDVGWITFDERLLAGCPSGDCAARVDRNGLILGWARACGVFADPRACSGLLSENAGGWDGWIHLHGTTQSGKAYGVSQLSDCSWSGYAWGSDTLGWIRFDQGTHAVRLTGGTCPMLTVRLSASPEHFDITGSTTTIKTTLSWDSSGADSCRSDSFPTKGAFRGFVTVPLSAPSTIFSITCTDNTGRFASARIPVTWSYAQPLLSLSPMPTTVRRGATTKLSWSVSRVLPDSCSITQRGSAWNYFPPHSYEGGGTVTSPTIDGQTSFTLTCSGLDGISSSHSVTVNLLPSVEVI